MRLPERNEWQSIVESIDRNGFAKLRSILNDEDCSDLISSYGNPDLYRSTIDMRRYRFGEGEYRYYAYPLPLLIAEIRRELYPPLSSLANVWNERLSIEIRYPPAHEEFIERCHAGRQLRPTPLILRYDEGGHNTLHQDLYGDIYFPFQVVFMLTEGGVDYEGGEFVMTEQVPRAQSKVRVIPAQKGDAVIFTTNYKPVLGTRGYYKATFRHGVSEVLSGRRYAMGVIFHDAT
jgi:uncharacterized protein